MAKIKQKPKSGKVVRLNKELVRALNADRKAGETWSQVIERRTAGRVKNVMKWALPSKLYSSKNLAIGEAIHDAAVKGIELGDREQPVKVFKR